MVVLLGAQVHLQFRPRGLTKSKCTNHIGWVDMDRQLRLIKSIYRGFSVDSKNRTWQNKWHSCWKRRRPSPCVWRYAVTGRTKHDEAMNSESSWIALHLWQWSHICLKSLQKLSSLARSGTNISDLHRQHAMLARWPPIRLGKQFDVESPLLHSWTFRIPMSCTRKAEALVVLKPIDSIDPGSSNARQVATLPGRTQSGSCW